MTTARVSPVLLILCTFVHPVIVNNQIKVFVWFALNKLPQSKSSVNLSL